MAHTSEVSIDLDKNSVSAGTVSGQWSINNALNKKYKVKTVQYPIICSSINSTFLTNRFSVTIDGDTKPIILDDMLPNMSDFVLSVNEAIRDEFNALTTWPQIIKNRGQWFWVNNSASIVEIVYPGNNVQVLHLGKVVNPGSFTINLSGISKYGPFRPKPRLGASSQTVTFPNSYYAIQLPLSGDYLDSIQYDPSNEIMVYDNGSNKAIISCKFPHINASLNFLSSTAAAILFTITEA